MIASGLIHLPYCNVAYKLCSLILRRTLVWSHSIQHCKLHNVAYAADEKPLNDVWQLTIAAPLAQIITKEPKSHKKRDSGGLKMITSYNLFCEAQRPVVREANPNIVPRYVLCTLHQPDFSQVVSQFCPPLSALALRAHSRIRTSVLFGLVCMLHYAVPVGYAVHMLCCLFLTNRCVVTICKC